MPLPAETTDNNEDTSTQTEWVVPDGLPVVLKWIWIMPDRGFSLVSRVSILTDAIISAAFLALMLCVWGWVSFMSFMPSLDFTSQEHKYPRSWSSLFDEHRHLYTCAGLELGTFWTRLSAGGQCQNAYFCHRTWLTRTKLFRSIGLFVLTILKISMLTPLQKYSHTSLFRAGQKENLHIWG